MSQVAAYAVEAKQRQGTRTDLQPDIPANLPECKPEDRESRTRAARQAAGDIATKGGNTGGNQHGAYVRSTDIACGPQTLDELGIDRRRPPA